ncbi:hypothetical protein D3C76_853600 [compost metagenome]
MARLQEQIIELAAGQLEAGGHFRQQAVVTHGEYRCGRALFAVLQYGGRDTHLHCATDLTERIRYFGVSSLIVADWQQACASAAATGIKLDPTIGERIRAESDRALGEAGSEIEHGTVRPLLTITIALADGLRAVDPLAVTAAVTEISVHVEVAVEQSEAAVFDEAFGLFLARYGQLRDGGDRQGETARFKGTHGVLH